ncbi:MAG: Crp/Fnr family transcriptional regulator [Sphingorhabdus sp.]
MGAPSLFSAFPEALRLRLQSLAVPRNFAAGQIIQQHGDEANGFWVIEQGQVKIGRYGDGGRFQVIAILGQGDSYGELAMFGRFARVVDAVAVNDVRLYWISSARMDRIIEEEPSVSRELLRLLSGQLQEALDMLIARRRLPAKRRLAKSLLLLVRGTEGSAVVNFTQEDLAELVGTSRMTISVALADMEARGLVKRSYGRIEICDIARLEDC